TSRAPARGIILSTIGVPPSALTLAAASQMARTCMAYSPGLKMPRRTPRSPSIGLASCRSLTLASISGASSSGTASAAPNPHTARAPPRRPAPVGPDLHRGAAPRGGQGDGHGQLHLVGQELVQGRVEQAHGDRLARHGLEDGGGDVARGRG